MDKLKKFYEDGLIIYPENKHKDNWDLFMAVVLICTCMISPVKIAFPMKKESMGWLFLDNFIDISFLIDIFVVFNTAYYDQDFKMITNRKSIAKRYIKSWFFVDLIAIIPFDIFF